MKNLTCCVLVLFIVFLSSNGKPRKEKIYNNLSFAIPGLNLLQGANTNSNQNSNYNNNNNNRPTNQNNNLNNNLFAGGNNIFRQSTVTRTIIRTVSTVTQAAYRTCTMPAAVMPCAGRRKREVLEDNLIDNTVPNVEINPEPTILLIIDSTTIKDQAEVSSILNLTVVQDDPVPTTTDNINSALADETVDPTTILYPSDEPSGIVYQDDTVSIYEKADNQPNESESSTSGTETPTLDDEVTTSNPNAEDEPILDLNENARLGLGGTTTVTTTIGVTSVATTFATGMSATLTIMYSGCLPPTLPASGTACMA